MNIFKGTMKDSVRYWDVPERRNDISLEESVAMMTHSMEDFVYRIYNRTKGKVGLGITGGRDSRVICSALAYKKIPFVPIMWKDHNFNDKVAPELCSIVNKQPHILENVSDDNEITEIEKDTFVYTDGFLINSYGFPRLAKACFDQNIEYLVIGIAGDRISGHTTFPDPNSLNSIEQLAESALNYEDEQIIIRGCKFVIARYK